MAEIRIEGKKVWGNTVFGGNPYNAGHLYLVYVDDGGKETVIRGGLVNGNLSVNAGGLLEKSNDARKERDKDGNITKSETPEERGSIVLKLGGRDPAEVWQELVAYAKKIGDAKIGYDIHGPNSNTLIAAVLRHVGIDVENVLPKVKGVTGLDFKTQKVDLNETAFPGHKIHHIQIPPYPGSNRESIDELMKKAELSPPQGQDNQQNPETGRDQQFPKRKQPSLSDKESFLDLRPRLPAEPISAEQQKTRITRPEPHPDKTLDNPENIFLAEQESRARLQQALAQIQDPTNDLNMIRQNETGQNKPLSQPEQKPVSDPQRAEFFRRQREIQQKRKHMLDPNQPSLLNLAPPGSELARILEERKQKLAKEKRKSLRANTNNTAVA